MYFTLLKLQITLKEVQSMSITKGILKLWAMNLNKFNWLCTNTKM
jgi:hypothetical protein